MAGMTSTYPITAPMPETRLGLGRAGLSVLQWIIGAAVKSRRTVKPNDPAVPQARQAEYLAEIW